jgi:hypothetical protein
MGNYRPPTDDEQCTARSKRSGKRCAKYAIPGLKVCKTHGGGTKAAQAAAARNVAAAAAQAAVTTYGLPIDIDPLDALLSELHRTAGHVAYLGQLVATLDDRGLGQSTTNMGRIPSVWVGLYQEERRHLANVAASCLRAGVDERRVQLAERQGQLVADVIRAILVDLGVDPANEDVRAVVRRRLVAVAS